MISWYDQHPYFIWCESGLQSFCFPIRCSLDRNEVQKSCVSCGSDQHFADVSLLSLPCHIILFSACRLTCTVPTCLVLSVNTQSISERPNSASSQRSQLSRAEPKSILTECCIKMKDICTCSTSVLRRREAMTRLQRGSFVCLISQI